jgi:hypothetical protein
VKTLREQHLRWQVEKWLGLGPSEPVHVTALRRARLRGTRCVCVEALLPAGSRALFFFRHDDGSWRVYPPAAVRRRSTDSSAMVANELSSHALSDCLAETSREFTSDGRLLPKA